MHVARVQIAKRHVRACVSHLGRERAQARCVVATTVLPHSCRVGRALLHPGRHLGLGEGATSVAHVPSGAVLSQWVMGRVLGGPAGSAALAWPQRECLGAHPTPAGSWSRDW